MVMADIKDIDMSKLSCDIPAPKLDMSEIKLTQMTKAGG